MTQYLGSMAEGMRYLGPQPNLELLFGFYCVITDRTASIERHTGSQADCSLEQGGMQSERAIKPFEGATKGEAEIERSTESSAAPSQSARKLEKQAETAEGDSNMTEAASEETESGSGSDFINKMALLHLLRRAPAKVTHFVTADSTMGMLMRYGSMTPFPEDGDTLCVIRGFEHALLLRSSGGDSSKYFFMGGCKLCIENVTYN